ncbi:MAG: hypothetical protein AABY15_06590 [Nanoarchaeota archaeon]
MELKEAQEIFNNIVDLCYDSGNPELIEVVESIYPDTEAAEDAEDIIASCEELTIAINRIDILPEEEEFVSEIQELIDKLNEEN